MTDSSKDIEGYVKMSYLISMNLVQIWEQQTFWYFCDFFTKKIIIELLANPSTSSGRHFY